MFRSSSIVSQKIKGDFMSRQPLESLGVMVREKRGKKKLRETAREIGIGPATLMRVENGRIPDIETFGKLCHWLRLDPGSFLGFDSKAEPTVNTPFTSLS